MIKVWLPLLPPSSNNIYIRHPSGKGRILSHEARTFKIKAMKEIQQVGRVAFIQLEQNVPYRLRLVIFFSKTEVAESSVGARYKKIDLSNMIKLVEDTVAEATGVDDSHNFQVILEKQCDPKHPGMYICLSKAPPDAVGLTKEQYDERQARRLERNRAN